MGDFITATEMKRHALVPLLGQLDNDVIELNFIGPAEKYIAEGCNLNLNTDLEPYRWTGYFENYPATRTRYQDDYKRAVIMTVNHMASNPMRVGNNSVSGASASYSSRLLPLGVATLMREWSEPLRLDRV
jgi:hypothetical protein